MSDADSDVAVFVSNFAFMEQYDATIAELGAKAEGYFTSDPNTSLFKLRQLVECLAYRIADAHRMIRGPDDDLYNVLKSMQRRGYLPDYTAGLCHDIRRAGNGAVHELNDQHREAVRQLRNARNVCVWYVGEFGDGDFRPPRFQIPPAPPDPAEVVAQAYAEQRALEQRLAELEAEGAAARAELEAQTRRMSQPRVSFSQTFMDLWDACSPPLKVTLGPEVAAFRDDPDAVTLNRFDAVTDDKFRWLPLGDDHCAVVAVSPHGDVNLVAWIGGFEEALLWVQSRRVEVNAVLGSLQVYATPEAEPEPAPHGLLAALSDEELQRCGVPPLMLPFVRAVSHTDQLIALGRALPQEAADVLVSIADGQSLDEAIREAGLRLPARPIDVRDFDTALGHQASRRSFAELDDRTFEEMLKAPIEQWRVFLHPSQARVVRSRANGPVRVLGGAGTGKTVALLHRVVHLIRDQLPNPADKLLVTTFTRTMASELRRNLSKLLTPEELERVTVSTLHQVARALVRDAGHSVRIGKKRQLEECWDTAIAATDPEGKQTKAFYSEEWDLVIQSQGITERSGYFRASRQGRGTGLNRRERAAIWKVFEAYRAQLSQRGLSEWVDLIRLAHEVLDAAPGHPYRSVLVDEVQDFGQAELRLLRAMVSQARADMFLVGDAHQRIYKLGTTLGACGIQIRGRSFRLKVNYRTTQEIQNFAFGVLEADAFDDLDGGADHLRGYHSLRIGTRPTVRLFATSEEERQAVVEQVRAWLDQGIAPASICVAARAGWLLKGYRGTLGEAGIATLDLDADADDEGDATPEGAVRLSTMHRLKGTEFSRVLLASVHDGVFPMRQRVSKHADEASVEDFLHQERCLMYVAATRARDELVITGVGEPSSFVRVSVGGRK